MLSRIVAAASRCLRATANIGASSLRAASGVPFGFRGPVNTARFCSVAKKPPFFNNGSVYKRAATSFLATENWIPSLRAPHGMAARASSSLRYDSKATSDDTRWSVSELASALLLAVGSTVAFITSGRLATSRPFADSESTRVVPTAGGVETSDARTGVEKLEAGAPLPPRSNTIPVPIPDQYETSFCALKGLRDSMEDECFVAKGGRFLAIFDGHGGGGVSAILRKRLYNAYLRYLRDDEENVDGATSVSRANALRDAFDEVDQSILQDDKLQYQGSTAVAVTLHEQENGYKTIVSANVGDSRAVLSRAGRAVELTRDHKPGDRVERARIRAMGGNVKCNFSGKICRVNHLALSRAMGDKYAKPIVSGTPEIRQVVLSEASDEFVLLASDGLWDVMSSQDAVAFVHKNLDSVREDHSNHADFDLQRVLDACRKSMSSFVANEAIRLGSDDNVAVAIVWLKELGETAGTV